MDNHFVMKKIGWFTLLCGLLFAQATTGQSPAKITPAAERTNVYVPLLKGKRVAVFANQTSMVGNTHLVDTLRSLGVNVTVIFGPEHGFRGTMNDAESVSNSVDEKTGIPVISLYGDKRRPSADDLKNVDIMLFDIQDVGVRFYTFISSLEEYMETALQHHKPLLVLDRPNPNGFYIDGPVLDKKLQSFLGRQPIPVVYGMTIGEYAFMLAGEKWLSPQANTVYEYYRRANNSPDTPFHFLVIKCTNYNHKSKYQLPVKPSPNLPEMQSIYLYPSTCFFEGTLLSEGRGTDKAFQVFGHPALPKNMYAFTPGPREGATTSKFYGQTCYGWNMGGTTDEVLQKINNQLQLKWLIEAYRLFPKKDGFFAVRSPEKPNVLLFDLLAGNSTLRQQIKAGVPEATIRKSWEPALEQFKVIRKKYLLYED
jgi:uncharacterized protein YbbC (DUF1343 family)